MLSRFWKLFWQGRDDDRRHETGFEDKARMLELDEPTAGAGGQLAGEKNRSETERALDRSAKREGR
jgi:hypothetical protein